MGFPVTVNYPQRCVGLGCLAVLARVFAVPSAGMNHTLGIISHLGFALLGLILLFNAVRQSASYRSLPMRLRGEQAKPMTMPVRVTLVLLGGTLVVVSVLLALGVVQ